MCIRDSHNSACSAFYTMVRLFCEHGAYPFFYICLLYTSVWRDIFDFSEISFNSFLDLTAQIFNCIKKGEEKYPSFFSLHSVSFIGEERQDGRRLMSETLEQIKDGMCTVLEKDKNIRNNVFDEEFTPRAFSEIILSLIISAMLRHDYDSRAVLKMIEKLIY